MTAEELKGLTPEQLQELIDQARTELQGRDELPQRVQDAVARCKEAFRAAYAPFNLEPPAYVLQACGVWIVCGPWAVDKRNTYVKTAQRLLAENRETELAPLILQDVLFWADGMEQKAGETAAAAALRYLTALARLGGDYLTILDDASRAYGEASDASREKPRGKKH